MGLPSPEEKDRNENLVRDYKSGEFKMVDLVVKYHISSTRIYQIINRDKRKTATT
jgi:Mor family transcriptional regulator